MGANQNRNKLLAVQFYKTMVDEKDPVRAMSLYGGSYYKQHNPFVEDEGMGFVKHFKALAEQFPHEDVPIRVIAENDYVVIHMLHKTVPSELPKFQKSGYVITEDDYMRYGLVSFDLFRFYENGKIIEHWDSMQWSPFDQKYNKDGNVEEKPWWSTEQYPTLTEPKCSHFMIDGEIAICDLDKTESNKSLVKDFVEQVLVEKNMSSFDKYFGRQLIQHIPYIKDGVSAYKQAIENLQITEGLNYLLDHRIVAEGNFVFVQSEADYRGRKTSVSDLFRVKDGKIAETWQCIFKGIPEVPVNPNTMF